MKKQLRIATRQSKLALWQSNFVKTALEEKYPDLDVHLIKIVTDGDRIQDVSLTEIGGKAVFVKALQQALLNNEADIAVHSMKDMSVFPIENLIMGAVLARADARDAFLSNEYDGIESLPKNAVVGTASPRRTTLLKAIRDDVTIKLLRGNVDTRLEKLNNGEYDAIILAAAGLDRLGLSEHIRHRLSEETFIPAIAQGAIAIECRANDVETRRIIKFLNDVKTEICVAAERAVNRVIGGDCHTPIAAHAVINGATLKLTAMLGDGNQKLVRASIEGPVRKAEKLGEKMGHQLLAAMKT